MVIDWCCTLTIFECGFGVGFIVDELEPRSYSGRIVQAALTALIRISIVNCFELMDFYPSFANGGPIVHLQTLASMYGDYCSEKACLQSMINLGQASLIAFSKSIDYDASENGKHPADSLRQDFLDIMDSLQYVPFSNRSEVS